ncbi:hypothetical protein C8F01DRAFT_1109398 [Mycena amicta]|nr:hypothetical protein C8F01DRAFT_1109398 [Mycena amicta]
MTLSSSTRLVAYSVWLLVRPYALPLFVSLSFLPLILFLSASAGWVVWQSAAVSWRAPLYLQYGDGLAPNARAHLPTLVSQQRYDISLDLQVPNVDTNFALGNFMAGLTLSTRSNKTIVSVRRPAIVVPPRTAFYSRTPSFVTVHIPLLASYATGAASVIADVEIGRRDHWKSLGTEQGRELSVISATLNGVVIHHGVRGLVTRFPFLSALVSSAIFMVVSSLVVGLCIVPLMFRRPTPTSELEIQPVKAELAISSDSSDTSDTDSRTDLKSEDTPAPILTTEANKQSTPLRRRHSKLVDPVSSDSDS